jgi:hypothetical protein
MIEQVDWNIYSKVAGTMGSHRQEMSCRFPHSPKSIEIGCRNYIELATSRHAGKQGAAADVTPCFLEGSQALQAWFQP